MKVFRSPHNPIIEPKDVKPSRDDFEVIGVLNTGVTRFGDEIILLLRVAERPINKNPDIVLTAVYDVIGQQFVIKEFSKSEPGTDFSDPRLITRPAETYLTSISHLRLLYQLCRGLSRRSYNLPDINEGFQLLPASRRHLLSGKQGRRALS
jgi:predicted GH43/DUF377 family glycosyl hydrolase